MQHKVKVTVLDKKLYPELQQEYCAVPNSGKCPCYYVGDEFIFCRNDKRDDFWHCGEGTLVKSGQPDRGLSAVAGHCALRNKGRSVLLRSMGRHRQIYLYRLTGRFHHAGMDEGRKHNDRLLF